MTLGKLTSSLNLPVSLAARLKVDSRGIDSWVLSQSAGESTAGQVQDWLKGDVEVQILPPGVGNTDRMGDRDGCQG
jgi:hypothetical protein